MTKQETETLDELEDFVELVRRTLETDRLKDKSKLDNIRCNLPAARRTDATKLKHVLGRIDDALPEVRGGLSTAWVENLLEELSELAGGR